LRLLRARVAPRILAGALFFPRAGGGPGGGLVALPRFWLS
jgi:hypothetical protein